MTSPPPKRDGHALFERFRVYLRDHNLPITHQREVIAAAVLHADGHLSVEDIEGVLRREGTHVGTATVYRTLELLRRAGLVNELDFGEGFKRYEPSGGDGQHHEHVICVECGRVVEFTSDRIERMNMLIAEEYGFQHHHHRLAIYGVCGECQHRNAATLGGSAPAKE